MDSFQIIESKDTFLFKNEICCATNPRVRQDIHTIAMLYSFTSRIYQVVEIVTLFTNGTENTGFAINRMEVAIIDYLFQLIDKLGTLQVVQLL